MSNFNSILGIKVSSIRAAKALAKKTKLTAYFGPEEDDGLCVVGTLIDVEEAEASEINAEAIINTYKELKKVLSEKQFKKTKLFLDTEDYLFEDTD